MAKGDIFVRIGVDVSALEKALNKATDHIEKFGKRMKRVGRDLTEAITVPIVGFGYAAMKSSREATFEFDRFGENIKRSMGTIGDDIAKAIDLHGLLKKASDAVAGLVTWFANLDKETKKTIVTMAAFAAAMGPVLMIGGRLIEAFGAFLKILVPLSLLLYKVVASIAIFVSSTVGWPALIIAATVALVGFAIGWDNIGKAAEKAHAWVVKTLGLTKALEDVQIVTVATPDRPPGIIGGPMGGFVPYMRKAPPPPKVTIPGAAPSGLSDAARNAIEDGPQVLAGTKQIVDGTQAMIDAQRKLGLELETSGNKAQYHQGMIAALKQEYIALREGGFASTSPEIQKITEDLRAQNEALLNSQTAMDVFRQKLEEVPPIAVQFGNAIYSMYQQIADGIGSALAQVIVYGANLHQVLKQLLKAIAAEIIQTLVRIGIQYVITSAIRKATDLANAVSSTASAVTTTYAEVFAQTSSLPFGWIIAAGVAAGAVALLIAGLAGAGGAAEGGIFTHSGMTRIAEKGKPEIVLNQDNVRKFMGGALGGGSQTIVVNLDSEPIISTVVRGMPAYLRLQGAI